MHGKPICYLVVRDVDDFDGKLNDVVTNWPDGTWTIDANGTQRRIPPPPGSITPGEQALVMRDWSAPRRRALRRDALV